MEWFITFTIIGLYAAQTFLVCVEYINPTPMRERGGFSRRSYWASDYTPAQVAVIERSLQECKKRSASGEKVNWKQEGF